MFDFQNSFWWFLFWYHKLVLFKTVDAKLELCVVFVSSFVILSLIDGLLQPLFSFMTVVDLSILDLL